MIPVQNAAVIFDEQSNWQSASFPVVDILAHKLILVGPGEVALGWALSEIYKLNLDRGKKLLLQSVVHKGASEEQAPTLGQFPGNFKPVPKVYKKKCIKKIKKIFHDFMIWYLPFY